MATVILNGIGYGVNKPRELAEENARLRAEVARLERLVRNVCRARDNAVRETDRWRGIRS